MSITIRDSSNAVIVTLTAPVSAFSADQWYFVAIDIDTTTGTQRAEMTIDGAVEASATPTADAEIEGGMDRAEVNQTVGETMSYSNIYVHLSDTQDMGITANREEFRGSDGKPVDLGSDGSTPLGTAPFLFYPNAFATFQNDESGNNNDLTVTGTLSAASSSPSD